MDHADGLFDPAQYFDDAAGAGRAGPGADRGARAPPQPDRPLYVVAEKILSARERLPSRWEVHGTTGYNYLNDLNGIFIDAAQARRMRRIYAKLTGHARKRSTTCCTRASG